MPRFGFLEFNVSLSHAECGKIGVHQGTLLHVADGDALHDFLGGPTDAHNATYEVRCSSCIKPMNVRPNGRSIVLHFQYNTPMGAMQYCKLAQPPTKTDLLGELFKHAQSEAISADVKESSAVATAANDVRDALALVRERLVSAATAAGLHGIEFIPDDTPLADVFYEDLGDGLEAPKIEFELISSGGSSPWVLHIRGAVARSIGSPLNPAVFVFEPLEIIIEGGGNYKSGTWQPMASYELDEDETERVIRLDYRTYSVDPTRLGMKITEIARR